jgi:hypothetical protein
VAHRFDAVAEVFLPHKLTRFFRSTESDNHENTKLMTSDIHRLAQILAGSTKPMIQKQRPYRAKLDNLKKSLVIARKIL